MASFICKCENKSYTGFYNKKKCKDCDTIIHFRKTVSIGSHQWKTQRIEDLKQEVKDLKNKVESLKHYISYGDF